MLGLNGLHRLAAPRGDGLAPELLALLERRALVDQSAAGHIGRAHGFEQAGPNPSGTAAAVPDTNVLPFPRNRRHV